MKRIKLTKISDDEFQGNHPNGIYEGYCVDGFMSVKPKVGYRFSVFYSKLNPGFTTSTVTKKLNKDGIFKTLYSTYKIEYIK